MTPGVPQVREYAYQAEYGAVASVSIEGEVEAAAAEIDVTAVAAEFGMSRAALAQSLGLEAHEFYAPLPMARPVSGERLREFLGIVGRVEPWAGGPSKAVKWYRDQPIPSLGNETAEALVRQGRAGAVQSYLDAYEAGGYA